MKTNTESTKEKKLKTLIFVVYSDLTLYKLEETTLSLRNTFFFR